VKKKTTKTLEPVESLADLRRRAQADASYRRLAIMAAINLGGNPREDLDAAIRWLRLNADETANERGVVDEVNALRRNVLREQERGDEIVTD
jgi:hypothetical protein